MSGHNAIVIMVDRLGAGWLGPYGNTWIETPAFNRLASQSLLWEQMIATAPTLDGAYRAIVSGRHPLLPDPHEMANLWSRLQQAGIHTALVTDETKLLRQSVNASFAERIDSLGSALSQPAEAAEQTQLARTFLTAMEWLDHPRDSFCLWLHARGMQGAWDAPREFRDRFAEEGDPPPPDFLTPPNHSLTSDADPDELLGIVQAYAGQIALLDVCLEMLLALLTDRQLIEKTLLVVSSPRGFPLGEHGHVGECGDFLYEELLHVPLLIRRPDQLHALERCQTLVQPTDVTATLGDWFQLERLSAGFPSVSLLSPAATDLGPTRELVVSVLPPARSIRTPIWFLRSAPHQATELYAKPDDRWEVNDVTGRCAATVDELTQLLDRFEQLASIEQLVELPELPKSLLVRTD